MDQLSSKGQAIAEGAGTEPTAPVPLAATPHVDSTMTRAIDLDDRFDTIDIRIRKAESKLACNAHAAPPAMSCGIAALHERWAAMHNRLAAAEQILRIQPADAQPDGCDAPARASVEVQVQESLDTNHIR